jgi:RHS repeat-associated protein
MVRRVVLLGVAILLQIHPALAVIQPEIGGSTGPSGTSPRTGWPTLVSPGFREEEPYRNPDMGPLGVVLSNGEFQTAVTDLEIPGRGFPFQLIRTYRSKKNPSATPIGFGWHLSYDEWLQPGSILDAGGESRPAIEWTMGDGWRQLWVNQDGGGYRPFGGFYGKIRSLGPNRGYKIRYPDGTVKTFAQSSDRPGLNIPVWLLSRIEDRNGNVLTLQFRQAAGSTAQLIASVTDTLGRVIAFTYDGGNRLSAVIDFTGRRIDYTYDEFDNLVSVKSPAVTGTPGGNDFCDSGCPAPRKTTLYRYASADGCLEGEVMHNLTGITNGNGLLFLTNRYHAAWDPHCGDLVGSTDPRYDFIQEQHYGDGVVKYDYRFFTPVAPGVETVVLETTVTDRAGNIQVHSFNNQGSPLEIVTRTNRNVRALEGSDEGDYTVTYHYLEGGGGTISRRTESGGWNVDASGRLVRYAEGMTVQYNYDSSNPDIFQRGNLLSILRTPDSGRGASQTGLAVSMTYEPLFNQPILSADPAGHVTIITYDFQEGSYGDLTAGSPPPAPVDPAWWSQGEIQGFMEGGFANRGDLNGDGYHRGGNAVRSSEGSITHADGTAGEEIATTIAYNAFGQPTIRRDAEYNETHFTYFPERDPDGDGSPTPAPPDGRSLSSAAGASGGGYLQGQVQDAVPAMPLPYPPPLKGRESGLDPPPRNIASSFTYDPAGNVRTTTDGRGIRTDYTVNALNQVVQIVRAAASSDPTAPSFGYREQFRYDAANNLTRRRQERRDDASLSPVDRWVTVDFAYDGLDRRISETASTDDAPPLSLTTRFAYDANGNLRKTIYPAGNAVLKLYDERNLPYREVALRRLSPDPLDMAYDPASDSITRYDYDGSGNLIRMTDPEGHAARNGYDGFGRKIVSFDPAFQKTAFTLDAAGRVTAQTTCGALGGATPEPAGPPDAAYPELSRVRFFYDQLGHLRRTDTRFFRYLGATQLFLTTDSNAGLPRSPDPLLEPVPAAHDGWTTSLLRYDRLGRIVLATDDNGHSTETRYDGLGRKIQVLRNPVAPFVSAPGGPDERNSLWSDYDATGNLVETIETEWGNDRSDPLRPERKLPLQLHRTVYRYDAMDRLVETTLVGRVGAAPLDLTTQVLYDSLGHRIQVTDPAGRRTKSSYDGLGRLLRTEGGYLWNGAAETIPPGMINPSNPDGKITTRYSYDADGRLTSLVDDSGRATLFDYDPLGRRTLVTYADGTFRRIHFDRDSLAVLQERISFSGARLAVATRYDLLHRAVQRDVDASSAPEFGGTKRQLFEFDGLGRMTRAAGDGDLDDGVMDSDVTLAYNSLGNVVAESQSYHDTVAGLPAQGIRTVSSFHDGTGFRTRVVYPGGRNVSFLPDELNRLDTLVDSYTGTTRYDTLGPSRLLNRIHPNGTKLTLLAGPSDDVAAGYDDARRVADLATRTTAPLPVTIAEFDYGHDAAGNRLFERRVHEPAGGGWNGATYEYDAAGRLARRSDGTLDGGGSPVGAATLVQTFTLDGPGNWRSTRRNSVSFDNTVNDLNQYSAFDGPQGRERLSYDFTGSLTAESLGGADRQYGYDFAGRLILFLDPTYNLTTYRYDALGRRISRTTSGSSVTRYFYDGEQLIEERDGAGDLVASYLHGPGTDEVISRRRISGGVAADIFYHADALGSVTAVTDASGAIVERYRYDAFGQVTFLSPDFTVLISSAVYNSILFTGRIYDPESRLYDFRARTYHPYLGRFLQRDPLGEEASPNLYAYVRNNPVNATDPSGMLFAGYMNSPVFRREFERVGSLLSGGEWGLQQRMTWQERGLVSRLDAQYRSFEEADADEERQIQQQEENDGLVAKRARAAAHNLVNQVRESLDKSKENMDDPKGIVVIFAGFNQSILDEHAGTQDRTDLDTQADNLRAKGFVVLELNADDMATSFFGREPSGDAVQFVSDVVQAISDNAGGHVPISIEGFSRGGGPAVALANELSARGMADSGNLHAYLIDPYVGRESRTFHSTDIDVHPYFSSRFSWVRPAGPLIGLGRDLFQNRIQLTGPTYSIPHGEMDSYGTGVLGLIDQHILGN